MYTIDTRVVFIGRSSEGYAPFGKAGTIKDLYDERSNDVLIAFDGGGNNIRVPLSKLARLDDLTRAVRQADKKTSDASEVYEQISAYLEEFGWVRTESPLGSPMWTHGRHDEKRFTAREAVADQTRKHVLEGQLRDDSMW